MTFEYNPFWFGILIGLGVAFISLALLFGMKIAYSEEGIIIENTTPELKCLEFSDGTLAIVLVEGCNGFMQTLGWLFQHNYHVETSVFGETTLDRMYLTR